jgi:hypothetical protein
MSNEFNYKSYLENNPLLSEDMRGMTPEMEEAVDLLIQMRTPVDTIESLLDNLTDDLNELPDEIDMDFFLNNIDAIEKEMHRQTRNVRFVKEEEMEEEMEGEPPYITTLADAAEEAYESGMGIKEILSFIEQHLSLKMGDY